MKNPYSILLQIVVSVMLASSSLFAAPTIDGVFQYTAPRDWKPYRPKQISKFTDSIELSNVIAEEGDYSGTNYDVEEIGIYIDNNILYLGIQTDYDLKNGFPRMSKKPGDFIFNFDNNNKDSDNFAFDFRVRKDNFVDFTLYAGNLQMGTDTSDFDNYGKKWEVVGADYIKTFTSGDGQNLGVYKQFTETWYNTNGSHTIEAAIDLDQLTVELNTLFLKWADIYNSVTMYWQPECGNDFLAARSDFTYTSKEYPNNPIPEPATFLLFGMGLMGISAFGRQKVQNKGNH